MILQIEHVIFPVLLIYFLDYCFGFPDNEKQNTKSILFGWSFFLAKQSLKKHDKWRHLSIQYKEQINQGLDRIDVDSSFRQIVFRQGSKYFTWQRIAGMCPVCSHIWCAAGFNLLIICSQSIEVNNNYFLKIIITFTLDILIGHLFIRLLKKYA